jgi:uncharacterized damage-inducible protein DinB
MNPRDYFAALWPAETKITADALRALPEDKLDYRPHPLTRSAREIVEHLLAQPVDMAEALTKGEIHHRRKLPFESLAEAVTEHEKRCAEVLALVRAAGNEAWEKTIPFYVGGRKMREGPLGQACFTFLFDQIHHRGQLSTYYRPMGARNPFIYGPTAEMIAEMKAARGDSAKR